MLPDNTRQAEFVRLYSLSVIPLRVVLPSLVWVLHDYFVTLEDEVRYVWPQKRTFGKFMFFWIRYYTILLLVFDVAQIHSFARKGVPNIGLCVAMDPTIRIVGAISLWSIEIVMQLRIYALYGRSKKVALFNGVLFAISIAVFIGLLMDSAKHRNINIASAMQYPLPGCPTINGGIRWAVWVPATLFEFNLFIFALCKSAVSTSARVKLNERFPLITILLQDNILYFLGVAGVLIMNNIMAVGTTRIPWFGYGPFHAALGIMTTRMHIHLIKFVGKDIDGENISNALDEDLRMPMPTFAAGGARPRSSLSGTSFGDDVESIADSSGLSIRTSSSTVGG
ncbi:hypothetical protein B0H34DRAFT_674292 [Crassisporium funariophilum]|nr:hypothetical protein B0H34DRAFT_674292 [Crassisporium funariophilum]